MISIIILVNKLANFVIPAKAGIQKNTGFRIKFGMTGLAFLVATLKIKED